MRSLGSCQTQDFQYPPSACFRSESSMAPFVMITGVSAKRRDDLEQNQCTTAAGSRPRVDATPAQSSAAKRSTQAAASEMLAGCQPRAERAAATCARKILPPPLLLDLIL
ncbi:hypothetical protein PHYPSEUDO_004378 [Phytophthora pseudosyringae]|uniref:Uncharacterized protein n=1 Tax=Phytophthora pseudosyringae TaxID=221518 RepID=A0A8T1VN64_9STRA|nr:hypothetical protein PHYPSEUDO_004378 [Phytophthora pseudosyringae]